MLKKDSEKNRSWYENAQMYTKTHNKIEFKLLQIKTKTDSNKQSDKWRNLHTIEANVIEPGLEF